MARSHDVELIAESNTDLTSGPATAVRMLYSRARRGTSARYWIGSRRTLYTFTTPIRHLVQLWSSPLGSGGCQLS